MERKKHAKPRKGFKSEDSSAYLDQHPILGDKGMIYITPRTGAIVMGFAKTKGYANKVDQEVNKLRRDASDLRKSSPEDALSHIADAIETMGKLFYLQRKMQMYSALTAAATGIGMDKSNKILKKLERRS